MLFYLLYSLTGFNSWKSLLHFLMVVSQLWLLSWLESPSIFILQKLLWKLQFGLVANFLDKLLNRLNTQNWNMKYCSLLPNLDKLYIHITENWTWKAKFISVSRWKMEKLKNSFFAVWVHDIFWNWGLAGMSLTWK